VNKAFWRNPAAAFFTFAFPLMFLVIFTSLLGHGIVHEGLRTVHTSDYYVAAMAAYAVIGACYSNIAMSRVIHAVFVALLLVVITAAFGRCAYQADIPTGMTLVRFLAALLVGSAAFSALAFAITPAIPNADAGPAIVNASIMPLLFLSGIFIPISNTTPNWIVWVARIFPVRHFAVSIQAGFVGTAFSWTDVAVVAAWGIGGLLVATRYFSWEPRR
jgi:ABC-2 type transport system permease protein